MTALPRPPSSSPKPPLSEDLLQPWLKVFLEEQRRQTKALNDLGCMVFAIAVVVAGMAGLSFLIGLLSLGMVR